MADRLVGEREERPEGFPASPTWEDQSIAVKAFYEAASKNPWPHPVLAEDIEKGLAASSPSPPDREQQIQTIIDLIQREPGDARKLAEAIVAALFGPPDDAKPGDD